MAGALGDRLGEDLKMRGQVRVLGTLVTGFFSGLFLLLHFLFYSASLTFSLSQVEMTGERKTTFGELLPLPSDDALVFRLWY